MIYLNYGGAGTGKTVITMAEVITLQNQFDVQRPVIYCSTFESSIPYDWKYIEKPLHFNELNKDAIYFIDNIEQHFTPSALIEWITQIIDSHKDKGIDIFLTLTSSDLKNSLIYNYDNCFCHTRNLNKSDPLFLSKAIDIVNPLLPSSSTLFDSGKAPSDKENDFLFL